MLYSTKAGVTTQGTHPLFWAAVPMIYAITRITLGREPIVTDAVRPEGATYSLHPHGLAWDLRANDVDRATANTYAQRLRTVLGPLGFDVVGPYPLPEGHIHVELDPKKLARTVGMALVLVVIVAVAL